MNKGENNKTIQKKKIDQVKGIMHLIIIIIIIIIILRMENIHIAWREKNNSCEKYQKTDIQCLEKNPPN
ncbi:hypothetical protein BDV40DRAFT_259459 [Aspergillus tamarii]|uniref:Uncharacterized protein n=1 Tax=Aspergillus tamarii TaxID=41984 RepID=A0A5N6V1S3_ASPTM|nr:hypothetical protein BDV40DRAFT_259459 [Aspergillus tamarii]